MYFTQTKIFLERTPLSSTVSLDIVSNRSVPFSMCGRLLNLQFPHALSVCFVKNIEVGNCRYVEESILVNMGRFEIPVIEGITMQFISVSSLCTCSTYPCFPAYKTFKDQETVV